jgi:hypothetical protein
VQQIAVGGVQLNQIEAGVTGIADRLTEIVDDPRDLSVSSARGIEVSTRIAWPFSSRREVRVPALSADGATGGCAARLHAAVGNTPGVPQLDGDTALFSVNAGGDFLPGGNLLRAVQARRAGVAFGLSEICVASVMIRPELAR